MLILTMRFSAYQKGTIFEVSEENPQLFSAKDIKRFLELENNFCRNKQEQTEYIRVRRSLAKSIDCNAVDIDVKGNILMITVL